MLATGRSDYPNQINNVLAFPACSAARWTAQATAINDEMNLAAARAIAAVISEDELFEEYIIPSVFNKAVVEVVAHAVAGGRDRDRGRAADHEPDPGSDGDLPVDGSGGLSHPEPRVAVAEIGDALVDQRAADQGAPVRSEGEDVGDHAAVGEDRGRVAGRVDERLFQPVLVNDRPNVRQEALSGVGEAPAHRGGGLVALDVEVVSPLVAIDSCHMASWPTSRESSERNVGASSMPSTETTIGRSSASSLSPSARSTISPTSHT